MSDQESKEQLVSNNQPRKRSKVSRACDSCRRKKIRCDAEYSSILSKVTKICTNCSKNNENCLFSRVPLKRGPSKGYIKDLEEKLEITTPSNNKPRARSFGDNHSPLKSINTNFPNASSNPNSNSSPIILPPLLQQNPQSQQPTSPSIQSKNVLPPVIKKSFSSSSPSSPRNSLTVNDSQSLTKATSPPIQGPFWKVPYEMPGNSLGLSNGLNSNNNSNSNTRRSSLDSLSSTSTTNSKSRLPLLKPSLSINSDNMISDSDDDFYSIKSNFRNSTQSLSPRNSVSSLSSLSNKINKNLNLNPSNNNLTPHLPQLFQLPPVNPSGFSPFPSNHSHFQPPVSGHAPPPPHPPSAPGHNYAPGPIPAPTHAPTYPPGPGPGSVPPNSASTYFTTTINPIETNLKIYYIKFHPNFPILPFNHSIINTSLESFNYLDDFQKNIIELFNLSLNSLIHYRYSNLNNLINLFHKVLSIYPFNQFNIKITDDLLVLFFSSLVLINYTILLNGDIYSLGISLTLSTLNDFKVLENFNDLIISDSKFDFDNIKFFLPKIYYSIYLIDHCYCLSFGIQSSINTNFDLLFDNLNLLVPSNFVHGFLNFKINKIVHDVLASRNDKIFKNLGKVKRYDPNWSNLISSSSNNYNFGSLFVNLIKDKYELTDYLIEILNLLNSINFKSIDDDDDSLEILNDYQLKLIRLLKKLSTSIINLSNYISTLNSQLKKNLNTTNEIYNPFLNVSYGQLFKLIKLSKLITDSLLNHNSNDELLNRSLKINNDLSISFNLLTSNLNYQNTSNNSTPNLKTKSPIGESNYGLGSVSINLIKNKIEIYNLSFNQNYKLNSKASIPNNIRMKSWNDDFVNTIIPFVDREDVDGWY